MAQLLKGFVAVSTIPKEKFVKLNNGKVGFYAEFWINDNPDQYGNTMSVAVQQTKEEREAGNKKIYVANAKPNEKKQEQVFVSGSTIPVDPKDDGLGLPF